MGMFDAPKVWSEHFKDGEAFMLEDARLGNQINTSYGKTTPVELKINDEWYSVIGQGLVNQVGRMEDGDLPARVKMERVATKSGNEVKQLVGA